ncbi:Isochorismatase hydrolase [Melanomma pulvis-pyrius CBS 109.77]|uniref:nicotinamidase n=1 Tax=Melanomma pulvis-pyrius CBS 109.77 TaxID=1314802 RepID=A0A6A6XGH1_9PLEO|nr:Isochorismatase hydrolase [Melanomma pulvis-pyrius CBS 109.77]
MTFKPALVIVDVQEDFCPPHGSLAVQEGRDIVPALNELLSLPFAVKIATKDFHPPDHISFASNHPPPDNKPFASMYTITNPLNPEETQQTRLWPDHCVQGTKGAELVPELHVSKVHHIVEKGQDKRVEMYSAFADPFTNPNVSRSKLAQILHDEGITDVYVAGLAADYCVKFTALDARKEGFRTWVVGEATRPVDPGSMPEVHQEYQKAKISVIDKDEAVRMVKDL